MGVKGPHFSASASPLLDNIIYAATSAVQSPNQTVPGQTVYDVWNKRITTMGSGSDFTAFQDFAGVPSLDVGFGFGSPNDPVYHYHSNYDSLHWMEKFGDPGFVYHRTMAQIMGLLSAQLADVPVISFRAAGYARALGQYVKKVEDKLDSVLLLAKATDVSDMSEAEIVEARSSHRKTSQLNSQHANPSPDALSFKQSLHNLHKAISKLTEVAIELDERARELEEAARKRIPWWRWPKWLRLALDIRKVNTKYKYLERSFLFEDGLDGRPWFKHVVFAPGLWTGYAGGKSHSNSFSFMVHDY